MAANRILIDSGALSALADGNKALRIVVEKAIADDVSIVVPTIVIAESTTGDRRDANVNRTLAWLDIIELSESIARDAARLRTRVRGVGVADAVVIATADCLFGTTVMTGDPSDLRPLAAVAGRTNIVTI